MSQPFSSLSLYQNDQYRYLAPATAATTRYYNGDEDLVRDGAVTFGQLQEFRPESESIEAYLDRVDMFFLANDIPPAKQVRCS